METMAKKNRKNKSQTPRPSELLGKPEEVAETEEVAEVAEAPKAEEPKEASTLEQIVAQLPENIREKALEELRKIQVQETRNEAAKAWVGFDTALRDERNGLPRFVGDLAVKHGVAEQLAGRVIKITYPDGKFSYTNSPKGSKGSGNGNGRNGFPTPWGKAVVKQGDKTTTYDSPSKAAEALGLQVEGMRNMVDVFENPHERGTKAPLPKRYKVDAVRGWEEGSDGTKHFIVTIT